MIVAFGGGGQLGLELTERAAARSVALQAFDHRAVDIADEAAVRSTLAAIRPDIVVNAAAYTKVDKAETEMAEAQRANVDGAAVVAREARRIGAALVYISTDYVFDGRKPGAYVEADPINPLGIYGRTKADGEKAVRAEHDRNVILRTSWVFGVHGSNLLKTALRLAAERDELRFVADQRGCPTSTYDIAGAILHIAPRLAAGETACGTYHFTGSGVTTWHGFVERIVAAQAPITGRRPPVIPITTEEYPTPARRPRNSELDSSLFTSTFGYQADRWERRVDWTVNWLLAHAAGAPR